MALVFKDRVNVTTTTAGTGTVTLGSAVSGYQDFSVIGNGNTTYYAIVDPTGDWEVGIGTYSSTGPTLSRDTVLESSNSGSLVPFGAGTKNVFVTYAAEKSVILDASGNVTPLGTVSSGTWQGTAVAVGYGGTGATTAQGAMDTLAGAVTSGQYLRGNGSNVVMSAIQASDVPTLNQNTTGTAGNVTGVVAAANGGTGQSSYTTGDLVYASGATTIAKLADVATGNALISGGVGVAPSYGKIGLTTHVSGTLPVANGGTGATSLTANNVILGNGTSAVQVVAPGTSGNVLTSNGTTWTSAAAASLLGGTDSASPFETALGYQAGNVNTGTNNTFIGYQAGKANTTGIDNTAVGYQALDLNTTGTQNVAIGNAALGANTIGGSNIGIGSLALGLNTTGEQNVAVGTGALYRNTTASSNVAVGHSCLFNNTTGNSNTAVGASALISNTTGGQNVAVGASALYSNTTGGANLAFGYNALYSNTTGSYNIAIGQSVLSVNNANSNIAIGYSAMSANTTGTSNTAIGYSAMSANTIGYDLTALGYFALSQNTTGINNTAVGRNSGYGVTTGSNNTLIGRGAGYDGITNLSTGSNNIIIGYNAAPSSATVSNETTIGNSSTTSARIFGSVALQNGSLREVKTAIGASDLNMASGNFFSKTISGTTTFTVSNAPAANSAISIILDLTNGGSATVNWWSGVKWAGGTSPTLTASGRDVLGFFTYDGGTTWTGLLLGKDVK